MNIIRIYERRIRELLRFYDFEDMGNEIYVLLFLLLFIWGYLCHLCTC